MRRACLAAGLLVLAVAWGLPSPLPPFSDHMADHVAVVAVAAPLLAWVWPGRRWIR